MARSYLMLFHDFVEKTERLPRDVVGRLVIALVRYSRGEKNAIDSLPQNEQHLFPIFAAEVDRANAKYEEISAKRKAAGKAGGKRTQQQRRNEMELI